MLVGGKDNVSEKAGRVFCELFPGLNVVASFSGYADDPERAIVALNAMENSAVICGMGAPRQERFLLKLKQSGWVGAGFTCGGFLDQVLEDIHYYPGWIDRYNLRFMYRLYREPGRLWRRYIIEYGVFIKRYLKNLGGF